MPYKMILYMKNGLIIESPNISPNNPKTKFGYEDRKIIKEINKTGRSMVSCLKNVISFEYKHIEKTK